MKRRIKYIIAFIISVLIGLVLILESAYAYLPAFISGILLAVLIIDE